MRLTGACRGAEAPGRGSKNRCGGWSCGLDVALGDARGCVSEALGYTSPLVWRQVQTKGGDIFIGMCAIYGHGLGWSLRGHAEKGRNAGTEPCASQNIKRWGSVQLGSEKREVGGRERASAGIQVTLGRTNTPDRASGVRSEQ